MCRAASRSSLFHTMENSLSRNSLPLLSTSRLLPLQLPPRPSPPSPSSTIKSPSTNEEITSPFANRDGQGIIAKVLNEDTIHSLEKKVSATLPHHNRDELEFDYEKFEEVAKRVLGVRDKASLWALAGISTKLVSHLQSIDSFSKLDDTSLQLGEFCLDERGNLLEKKEEPVVRNKEIHDPNDKDLLDIEREDVILDLVQPLVVVENPSPVGNVVSPVRNFEEEGELALINGGGPVLSSKDKEIQNHHACDRWKIDTPCIDSIKYDSIGGSSHYLNHLASFPNKEKEREESSTHEGDFSIQQETTCLELTHKFVGIVEKEGNNDLFIKSRPLLVSTQISNGGLHIEKGETRDDEDAFNNQKGKGHASMEKEKRELQLLTMGSGSSSSHGEYNAIPHLTDHLDKKKQFSNYELVSWDFFTHGEVEREDNCQKSSQFLNSNIHLADHSVKEWMNGESSSHGEDFSFQDDGICGHKSSYGLIKKAYDGHDTCTIQTIECGLLDTYGAGQVDIQGEETCRRLDSQQKYKEKINYDESLAKGDSGRKAMGFKWKTPSWLKQGTTQPRMQARRMIVTENSEIEERQSAGKITTESRKTTLIDDKNKYSLATNTTKMAPAHENSHAHKDTILEGFHTSSRRTLRFVAPESQHGIPIVKPKREVVEEGAKKWNTTAIGYLLGQKPYFYHLQSFARATWKGIKDIIVADNGFFLFIFDTEKRMEDVIQGGPWLFKGQPLFLQKWHPGMNLEMKKHRHVPVWVKLRNLPLEYWTTDGLSVVASGVGQPLYPDTVTKKCTRIDYARVCVLIDLEGPLPAEVVIVKPTIEGGVGGPCKIGIEYEWLPKKCSSCQEFGHVALKCPKKKKDNHSPTLQIYLPKKSDMTQPHQNKEEKRTMDKLKPRKVKQQWVPRAGTRPCPSPCNNRPQIEEKRKNHEDNPRGTRPTTRPCSQPCSSRVSPANFPNTTRPGTRPCSRPCSPRSSIPIGSGDIVLSNSFARLEDLEEDTNQCTTEDQSQGPKQCSPSIYAP